MVSYDVVIVGAGAAGLFCALTIAQKKVSVCVLEKSTKAAKKIRISGGGRCNFTNLFTSPENYISDNPHFCKSALSRFTPYDFMAYLESKNLSWNEKHQGQLFCDQKANAVADALLTDCEAAGVIVKCDISVSKIESEEEGFIVTTDTQIIQAKSVVIASGGPSIPKMGATDFALSVAKQFGLRTVPFAPALVPLLLADNDKFVGCEGVAFPATVSVGNYSFTDDVLITHKGLSGPAILQISSYWQNQLSLQIQFLTEMNKESVLCWLSENGGKTLLSLLKKQLPNRLAQFIAERFPVGNVAEYTQAQRIVIAEYLTACSVVPTGTEGMRVAEVSRGGVATSEISSKTFESKQVKGLYFIGESIDVTGHLGGFNFQWAWASGYCAGEYIADLC